MSAQHTPGRLVVRPHGGNWSASYEGYGATAYMGIVSDTGEVVALATAYSPNPFRDPEGPDENARRLAACWNACQVITDPENVVPRLLALNELVPNLEHQAATLRVQRDELLAALEGLTGDIQALIGESDGVAGLHMNGDVAPWGELEAGGRFERLTHLPTAHAAIAKVEGGAV